MLAEGTNNKPAITAQQPIRMTQPAVNSIRSRHACCGLGRHRQALAVTANELEPSPRLSSAAGVVLTSRGFLFILWLSRHTVCV